MAAKSKQRKSSNGGNRGFEAKLWQAADALRNKPHWAGRNGQKHM
jgi:hypothetical protein